MTKQHALDVIAQTGSLPAGAGKDAEADRIKSLMTRDDRMVGTMLAQEVWTHARLHDATWRNYAQKLIRGTMEARAAFISGIKDLIKDAREANTLGGVVEVKDAAKRVRSATVEVSKLQQVANAWNAGAHEKGLLEFARKTTNHKAPLKFDDVSYTLIVEYSRNILGSGANGRGRPAKALYEKLGTWIEQQGKADMQAGDAKLYAELQAVLAKYTPKNAPAKKNSGAATEALV